MGYRSGPSPQDVRLAEPADLEAVQVEPAEHAPQSLSRLGEELDCQAVVRPLPEPLPPEEVEQEQEESVAERVLEQREEVEVGAVTAANYVPGEKEVEEQGPAEEEVLVCPPAESPVCEAASCPVPLSAEEPERPEAVITLEEDDEATGEESQVEHAQKVTVPGEQEPEMPTVIELDPASPAAPEPQSPALEGAKDSKQQRRNVMTPDDTSADFVCLSPASASAPSPSQATVAVPHKPLVPCYWSLELLIAAAFCTDVPPFPLFPLSAPSVAPSQANPHQGMELLSELADLELQQQKRTCGKSQGEGQARLPLLAHINMHAETHSHQQNALLSLVVSFSCVSAETNSHSPLRPSLRRSVFPPRYSSLPAGLESLWWILTCPQRSCLHACLPFLFFGVLKALLFSKRLF